MHAKYGSSFAKISIQQDDPRPPAGFDNAGGVAVCPLNGQCQTKELVYQETVVRTDTCHVETYTGLTGGTFNDRYNKHMSYSRNETYYKSTTLNKYICQKTKCTLQNSMEETSKGHGF